MRGFTVHTNTHNIYIHECHRLCLTYSVVIVLQNADLLEAATSVLRATCEKLAALDSQKVSILNRRQLNVHLSL